MNETDRIINELADLWHVSTEVLAASRGLAREIVAGTRWADTGTGPGHDEGSPHDPRD